MEVGGQRHAPAALPPGKTRYPLYRRLGGAQGRSGRVRKISPPQGFDPRTAQPVASRYTDWAIAAPIGRMYQTNIVKLNNCEDGCSRVVAILWKENMEVDTVCLFSEWMAEVSVLGCDAVTLGGVIVVGWNCLLTFRPREDETLRCLSAASVV